MLIRWLTKVKLSANFGGVVGPFISCLLKIFVIVNSKNHIKTILTLWFNLEDTLEVGGKSMQGEHKGDLGGYATVLSWLWCWWQGSTYAIKWHRTIQTMLTSRFWYYPMAFKNVYLFIWKRDRETGRECGWAGERQREGKKKRISGRLHSVSAEPKLGLDPHDPWDHDLSKGPRVGPFIHWATQVPRYYAIVTWNATSGGNWVKGICDLCIVISVL